MQVQIHQGSGSVDVSEQVLGTEFNEPLVHQVVTAYLAGGRAGTKAQRSRSDVSGGGRKPWRQKGTGRARAGTIRSPLWTGGGKTFAARPRNFGQKVNRKMYRGAMRAILSELLRQERLLVVPEIELKEGKTKELVRQLKDWNVERGMLVVSGRNEKLRRATGNIPRVELYENAAVNPPALAGAERVVVTTDALKRIEEGLK